jgi:preprotein translocase subunit SecA
MNPLTYIGTRVFGTKNDRVLKSLRPLVQRINELEPEYKALTDADFKPKADSFRERIEKGESLDQIKPEVFALVREASVRTLGMRHFDVQLIGGEVLHSGQIAEMKTGEGKTLVATLAASLNGLSGNGVHIVTVNDYLAKRDAEWMGRVYNFLGLSVGVVYPGMSEAEKHDAYRADITYGQNNEFGFDYLRDNMKFTASDMMQRGHHYAIVDEVDSILIDEARTPLIISGPAEDATEVYYTADKLVPKLKEGEHYEIDLKQKSASLTEDGVARAEELLEIENLYDPNNIEVLHHINQSLQAHFTKERDVDYVVKDGEVIIVDEFTGRLMPGRRWSDGLHQAIEAKEKLPIARENQTLASITFQNYFRMYEKLSGMTGTADTEAVEFKSIYNLDVVVIPTNKPLIRDDQSDVVFRTRKEKYDAVAEDIIEIHETGQPVLVGTISIEQSENLAKHLKRKNVPHNVLNAKQHEREAEIVAQAGRFGAVTISTNMAGRGTDIVLGGNPEALAFNEAGTKDRDNPAFQEALERYSEQCAEEKKQVLEAGGLFIMGTERHESRRIDNQLRGRAGRQGDPGVSRFYVSLEDDLMARFGGERMQSIMNRLGWEEGAAIDGKLISRSIENAQKRVEGYHFEARKHVTEYDDVMNKQRQVIYNLRSRVLHATEIREEIFTMIDDLLEELVFSVATDKKPANWDMNVVTERFKFLFDADFVPGDIELTQQSLFDELRKAAKDLYAERIELLNTKLSALKDLPIAVHRPDGSENELSMEVIEQDTLLETLDYYWNSHLQEMDNLREGIGLRGYGQKDPKREYQREGFLLFQKMLENMKEIIVRKLYFYEVPDPDELMAHFKAEQQRREEMERRMQMMHANAEAEDRKRKEQELKNPNDQRAKIEARKKARRRKRK